MITENAQDVDAVYSIEIQCMSRVFIEVADEFVPGRLTLKDRCMVMNRPGSSRQIIVLTRILVMLWMTVRHYHRIEVVWLVVCELVP